MTRRAFYAVNGITVYRIVAVPLLLALIFRHEWSWFRWLLVLSFLTDAVDGFLARRYHVISKAGAILDSIGDDLTVLVAIIGMFVLDPAFFRKELAGVLLLLFLYCFQLLAALVKYGRLTSFHTWLAKAAAILQGCFLILFFFLSHHLPSWLFLLTAGVTCLDLLEEIIMVFLLPHWRADVRGLHTILGKGRK